MPKPWTEARLRKIVAKKLEIPKVGRRVWSASEMYVRSVLDDDVDESERPGLIRDLCKEVAWRMRGGEQEHEQEQEQLLPSSKRRAVQLGPAVPAHAVRRARAFSDYVGVLAAENAGVLKFRALLGGEPLGDAKALELLRSEALRYCSEHDFQSEGIPLCGIRSRVLPGVGSEHAPRRRAARLEVRWKRRSITIPIAENANDPFDESAYNKLAILGHRGNVIPGSLFDDLRSISVELAHAYGWDEQHATWFVLTNKAPFMPPVTVQTRGRGSERHMHRRITLVVESWVAASTVLRVYEDLQKEMRLRASHGLSERNLALLTFVARRGAQGDFSWRQYMTEWNRKHPRKWKYYDPRNLRRDYLRTHTIVAFSG